MTTKIATLGPAGTFSELAARDFAKRYSSSDIAFYSTLRRTIDALEQGADIVVVPIENIVEGIVSPVVDSFVRKPLQIIAEVSIPVRFSVVMNHPEPQRLFAQFVAQGQCSEWLTRHAPDIVTTASNTEALALLLASNEPAAALIPEHLLESENTASQSFAKVVHDVTDFAHNVTRFVALQAAQPLALPNHASVYKSAVVIVDDADHPGLLLEHLQAFAVHQVNLLSLVSRPTGQKFGQYHFFIEFEGHLQHNQVQAALSAIKLRNRVIELGSYTYSSSSSSCN
ncbi:prephenate dehydratase [Pseudidiomarina andamanensis]|uniref:prephenate dehydratase n=1 Tax=Pseudidiomarina andamanensis TaxID=1940690 RepID=UPI001565CB73|nr:prephenate dehydratase domain-containing protein [Pseudidiomarina andamanensis]MDS0219053.1 prephenate dehydratase [Pseudidiomarina andamanensis]